MHVARDDLRFRLPQPREVLRDPAKRLEGLTGCEVADVLAHEDVVPDAQCHAVLQMRAKGENTG